MELEIITERESSSFRHIFPEISEHLNGRRYGQDLKKMEQVMGEFLDSLHLPRDSRTLEVGAGHGQEPSKALLALGAKPATLDADWNEYCKGSIPTIDDLDRIGEAQLYPMLAGQNGITHYLGDVAFIKDGRSQLRNERFDLLFYWGSIHGTDFCSSVQRSRTSKYNFKRDVPLEDRLVAPIDNVENSMAYVSGFFNGTGDPSLTAKNIIVFNGYMVDTALLWANYQNRQPQRVLIFGLSPDFAFEYARGVGNESLINKPTEAEYREAVDNDTIGKFMTNHWSMFSDYKAKDSSAYKKALEVFSQAQQKAISDLGLVDCVAVQYK